MDRFTNAHSAVINENGEVLLVRGYYPGGPNKSSIPSERWKLPTSLHCHSGEGASTLADRTRINISNQLGVAREALSLGYNHAPQGWKNFYLVLKLAAGTTLAPQKTSISAHRWTSIKELWMMHPREFTNQGLKHQIGQLLHAHEIEKTCALAVQLNKERDASRSTLLGVLQQMVEDPKLTPRGLAH